MLWRRKWLPTPVFLPEEFHGQRSLAGYSPWGCKESDTTERLTLTWAIYFGVFLLFCSCLQLGPQSLVWKRLLLLDPFQGQGNAVPQEPQVTCLVCTQQVSLWIFRRPVDLTYPQASSARLQELLCLSQACLLLCSPSCP